MSAAAAGALSAFYRPQFFSALTSTNDEAKRQADAGAPEGTLIIADEQSAGRGRMGRDFSSPPGNLYMSLILRPGRPAEELARLSFVAAVALGEAIVNVLPTAEVSLKWPNDVLLQGRKVSGILLESAGIGRRDAWLVVGVGVNLVSSPAHLGAQATSLVEAGWYAAERDAFLPRFAGELEQWYGRWRREGFAPVRVAWLRRAAYRNERIAIRLPQRQFTGTFADLDQDGTLIVLDENGASQRVGAGEIFRIAD